MSKQVGLGIGDETRIGEAESAFTSVQEPKVNALTDLIPIVEFYGN